MAGSRASQELYELSGYDRSSWCFNCFKGSHKKCSGKRKGGKKCGCKHSELIPKSK